MFNVYTVSYEYRSFNLNNEIYNVVDTVLAPNHKVAEAVAVQFIPKKKWSKLCTIARVATNVEAGNHCICGGGCILHHNPVLLNPTKFTDDELNENVG